ncbi:MAG: DUF2452 domain-containing protein [Bacteroidota bacterium]
MKDTKGTKETSKKPDNVVFDEKEQSYNAALKPYATNVGSPKIVPTNLSPWKNQNVRKVNHAFTAEFDEIRQQNQDMMERYEYNNLVYGAKFSFQPNVGEVYHLYKNKKNESFLSILSPSECNFEFLGSFRLGSDYQWEKMGRE